MDRLSCGFDDRCRLPLLGLLGKYLQSPVRLEDIVCRYGGEEFVLILPSTGTDEAVRRTTQVQEGARRLRIEGDAGAAAYITLSAGVAVFPARGGDSETLLGAADRALYDAKTVRPRLHRRGLRAGADIGK